MKKSYSFKTLTGALMITVLLSACQTKEKSKSKGQEDKSALERFQDMKFGMFIHWGLYAVPAGEWKGEYVRGIGEWIMQRKKIPVTEYEQLASQFNPVKFNADEWSKLAADAGMKYMVITSKHHDGFAMYDSKVSDYNIVDRTPFGRDPMKELAKANSERGIKFGFYYSQAQDWHEANAAGNEWDFPVERDPKPYVEGKALPQVEELLDNYGPLALIWFDTPRLLTEEQAMSLKIKVKEKQPDCLVNNRIGYNLGDYYQMGDNSIPTLVYDWKAWEIPATLNDTWGYKKMDNNWKDPADLIYKLTDIVSKGGNYLLNVGPTAEGIIPEQSQEILRTIGQWLKVNGEAIYETGHTPFYNTGIIWRCTTKPGMLYFHILNWPGTSLEITGLESMIKKAWFLANGEPVKYTQDGNKLIFELPAQPVDKFNTVIAVSIKDDVAAITPGLTYDAPQKAIELFSLNARIGGEEARYDRNSHAVTNFIVTESPKNELLWYHYPHEAGSFAISIEYACTEDIGSNFYLNLTNRDDPNGNQALNGVIQSTSGEFKSFPVGNMQFREGEYQVISFGLNDGKSSDVMVRKIILERIAD